MAESMSDNMANATEPERPPEPHSEAEAVVDDKQLDQTTPMPPSEPQQSVADSSDPIAQIDTYMREAAVNMLLFTHCLPVSQYGRTKTNTIHVKGTGIPSPSRNTTTK